MQQIILGALALGLLWAVMTIGVYCTYRILDIADLSVEGSITMGAAVAASMIAAGVNP
ncbi:MAG: ABC transporter permease, partial [Firmicutes bacterium HGW-Firmicutes-6]